MPAPSLARCAIAPVGRRRVFWVTQPEACGDQDGLCATDCGRPGLELIEHDDGSRTIATDDYIRGLILNKLLTDGRKPDDACGHRPGTAGGHWSESFRQDGNRNGSRLRDISIRCGIDDAVSIATALLTDDLSFLTQYGLVRSLDVSVSYAGRGQLSALIEYVGESPERHRVGVSGQRLANGWVWSSI